MFQEHYIGDVPDSSGTAMSRRNVAPGISYLMGDQIVPGMTVIDYGAGRGFNADWLRNEGVDVWAYDPYHGDSIMGNSITGWKPGSVSRFLPDNRVDAVITSYVLNVVTEETEAAIIDDCIDLADHAYHITRNRDIIHMIKGSVQKVGSPVHDFFFQHVVPLIEDHEWKESRDHAVINYPPLSMEMLEKFAEYGTITSKGFQRIPTPPLKLLHSTFGWKIYKQ